MEPKNYGLRGEKFFHTKGSWFFAVVSALLATIVWFALKINPMMAFGAVIGSTISLFYYPWLQAKRRTKRKRTDERRIF